MAGKPQQRVGSDQSNLSSRWTVDLQTLGDGRRVRREARRDDKHGGRDRRGGFSAVAEKLASESVRQCVLGLATLAVPEKDTLGGQQNHSTIRVTRAFHRLWIHSEVVAEEGVGGELEGPVNLTILRCYPRCSERPIVTGRELLVITDKRLASVHRRRFRKAEREGVEVLDQIPHCDLVRAILANTWEPLQHFVELLLGEPTQHRLGRNIPVYEPS